MHRAISRLRRRQHAGGDDGFTIIELAVASGVMLFMLAAMAYATTVGFVDIGYAKQRQGAAGLANETLEIVRALPRADLERGLDGTDLATSADPNITAAGTTPETYLFRGERIPYGPNAPVAPLVPHQQARQVSGTNFVVSTYLTRFKDDAGVEQAGVVRATAIVTWANAVRKGASASVEAQTLIYFAQGCQSPSTHPFAAPCEAAFYANATTGPGETRIEGMITDVPLRDATVAIGEESSDLQTEQVMVVQSFGRTPGATIRYSDATADETTGRIQTVTSSSNNPTEARPPYDSTTASQTAGEKTKLSSSGNGLRLNAGAASLTSVSTIAASSPTPSQPCPHSSSQTDNLPCGWTSGSQGSALESRLVLAGRDDASMLSVATATSSVTTNRDMPGVTPSTPCTNDGCVSATATRVLGETRIGGLPGGVTAPALWEGYVVKLSNYSAIVKAEAGHGTSAPTTSISALATIRYWNGTGYTDILFPSGSAGASIPAASVSTGDTTITATLATGGHSILSESECAGACRGRAEARVLSPVIGTVTYTVGSTANLTMTIDFGTLVAKAAYAPSPGI